MKLFLSKVLSRLYGMTTGTSANHLRNSYEDVSGSIEALNVLMRSHGIETPQAHWEVEFKSVEGDSDTQDLAKLFNHYGSDKSSKHNYHLAYGAILKGRRYEPLKILEIGLGTNNPSLKSSMGREGKPGASVRAFRDWAPKALVYGADIDRNILFTEERIKTYFVDQTKPETFAEIQEQVGGGQFDLIIDDGLHNTWANFNTTIAALPLLKKNGVLVIEDILDHYLPLWSLFILVLSKKYNCQLIRMKTETICIVREN